MINSNIRYRILGTSIELTADMSVFMLTRFNGMPAEFLHPKKVLSAMMTLIQRLHEQAYQSI
jgi:hypothetical protein